MADILDRIASAVEACCPLDAASATALTGGSVNWVWRVGTKRGGQGGTVVVKYSPPFLAFRGIFVPFLPSRAGAENEVLSSLGPDGPLSSVCTPAVVVPCVLAWAPSLPALVLSDLHHTHDLLDGLLLHTGALTGEGAEEARREAGQVGAALGAWLAGLHCTSSATLPPLPSSSAFHNAGVQELRAVVQYDAVGSLAAQLVAAHGMEGEVGERTLTALSASFTRLGKEWKDPATYGFTLTHGDLWPRSVLLLRSPHPTQGDSCMSLGLIDWEFSSWGSPAQDVAHLAAHCWMAGHAWSLGARGGEEQAHHAHGGRVGDSPAGLLADPPHWASGVFSTLEAAVESAWDAHPRAAASPAAALLRAFLHAYRAGLRRAVEGGRAGALESEWVARGEAEEARACTHCSAEILARLGAFRQGYIYDSAWRAARTGEEEEEEGAPDKHALRAAVCIGVRGVDP